MWHNGFIADEPCITATRLERSEQTVCITLEVKDNIIQSSLEG